MERVSHASSNGGIDLIPGYRHKLTQTSIGEWNLWGRLREVVVGTPEGTILPNYEAVNEKVAAPELVEMMRKYGGRLAKDVHPDFYAALERESNELVEIYESYGVKVHRPRPIKPEETAYSFGFGCTNIFSCDPFWCVGRNIIESSWRKKSGWPQKWAVRELYQPKVDADPSVHLHACPMPSPGDGPGLGDYYFEVGDMLVVGDGNVILAYDEAGTSSNPRGCEWTRRILEADGFKVTVVKLPDTGILHLFAVICIIGPGTAIAYEGAFPGRKLPEPLEGWNVVWCDLDEAKATAPCAVNIDRETVVLPRGAPRTRKAVSNLGFNVIDVEFSVHAMAAGGIRCATGVIYREID